LTRPGDALGDFDNTGGSVDRVTVLITVYHGRDYYDEGAAIADAIRAEWDRTEFALANSDKVCNLQCEGRQEIDDDEGAWYFILTFTAMVYVAGA
jgi:hypothetical protein